MPALDHSVVLRIIECCDWRTIQVLFRVPVFRQLIQKYGISIVKAIIRPYMGHEIIDGEFVLDSLGQPSYQRTVLPAFSWRTIEVVERRDDSTWPRLSSPAQRETLRQMVREALCCCDRLADIEACVMGTETLNLFDAPPLAAVSLENDLAHRMGLLRGGHLFLAQRTQAEISRDGYVRWRVRRRQGQYLRSLSTRKLLCIALFLRLAATRFHGPQLSRPSAGLQRTYISGLNEVLLRHGTWYLLTWNSGTPGPRGGHYHAVDLICWSAWDLRAYLHRTDVVKWQGVNQEVVSVALDRELRQRLDAPRREDAVETKALLKVDEMIRGPQTVRPVTFMFANVASQLARSRTTAALSGP